MADLRFDDGKEDVALRTIGEVSKALGIRAHVLRYWEQQFPMLQPLKRSGGRRYYRSEDIALIEQIDRLVNREGYTLKGANKALKPTSSKLEKQPDLPLTEPTPPVALLPQLEGIRARLARALEA